MLVILKIELPYTVTFNDNTIFYVDDVCIPHVWHTVELGVNDKLYLRTILNSVNTDYVITLTPHNYNGTQLATELMSKLGGLNFNGSALVPIVSYDSRTSRISVSITGHDCKVMTDLELKTITTGRLRLLLKMCCVQFSPSKYLCGPSLGHSFFRLPTCCAQGCRNAHLLRTWLVEVWRPGSPSARLLPGDRIPELRSAGTIVPSGLREGARVTKNIYKLQGANQNPPSPLRILAICFLIPPDAASPRGIIFQLVCVA